MIKRVKQFVLSLLLVAMSMTGTVYALDCNDNASGNWSTTGTWTSCGGGTPSSSDNVTIDSFNVTLDADEEVHNLIISTGSLDLDGYELTIFGSLDLDGTLVADSGSDGPSTILVGGIWDATGGLMTMTDSTVMFIGTTSGLTITSNAQSFNNVIINGSVGLVGYWKLDEVTGTIAYDSSGYANDGFYYGNTASSTDVSGTINFHNPASALFDGTADHINTGMNEELNNLASSITITAWIYPDTLSGYDGILSAARTNSANGFAFSLDNGDIHFTTYGILDYTGTTAVSALQWSHVAVVFDSAFDATYYLNGINSETISGASAIPSNTDDNYLIGAATDSGGTGLRNEFDGKIDEVRVYNRELTDAQIARLANGNMPATGPGTYTLIDSLDVNGTLQLNDGTLDVSASNYQVNVAGNWANFGGIFNARSGTVVLDGPDQEIPASETFYNIKKQITSSSTITFGRSSTITIGGTFAMDGFDASNYLTLQSSSVGTRWNIDVASSQLGTFLDVRNGEVIGSNDLTTYSSLDTTNNDSGEGAPQWVISAMAASGTFIWDAGGDGVNWNGPSNWDLGDGYPDGTNDFAIINTGAATITTPTGTLNIGGLTLGSSFTGMLSIQGTLDVDGSFSILGGTFSQNIHDLFVSGTFTIGSGATFIKATTGTLYLDGDQNFFDGTSPQQDVGRVLADPTTTLTSDMTATSLTIAINDTLITDGYGIYLSGTMDINGTLIASSGTGGNSDIHVGGIWDATGGLMTMTDSTVMFTGTTSGLTITSNAQSFNNLIVNGSVGLIGYWKLDETSSPAIDYSGFANHGTWNGNTSTINVTGTINYNNPASGSFPGATEYIQTTSNELKIAENFTIALWFKADATDFAHHLIWQGDGAGNGYGAHEEMSISLGKIDGGSLGDFIGFHLGNDDEDTSPTVLTAATAFTDTTNWHHVVAVVTNMSTSPAVELFLDGVSVDTDTGTTASTPRTAWDTDLRIGRPGAATRFYNGLLDEIRIYTRALTATEIQRMANGYMPGTGLGTYTLQDNFDVNGTLSLNDGTLALGSSILRNVGGSWLNHGGILDTTAAGGQTTFDGTGIILSGSQTFRDVAVSASGTYTLWDNIAVESGFDVNAGTLTYATSTIIEPIIVTGDSQISGTGVFTGNARRFRFEDSLNIMAGTFTAPTNVLEIDGDFDHTGGTFTNSSSTVMFTGTESLRTINTTAGGTFQDVIINDGLVGYWKLDEASSPSYDYSGYYNSGIWMGNPTSDISVSGSIHFDNPASIDFDGTGDYIEILADPTLDVQNFTVSAWFRSGPAASWTSYPAIFMRGNNVGNNELFVGFTTTTDDSITIGLNNSLLAFAGGIDKLDQQWHHIGVTYNTVTLTVYVDGLQFGTPIARTDILDFGNSNAWIGTDVDAFNSSFGNYWDGDIDDVRLYNRALTQPEIQRLANGNQPSTGVGIYTLQTALDVDGTLRLNSGTLDVSATDYQVNVGSDWENLGGIFNARTGTVILDGGNHWIPASETFYHIEKQITSASKVTFGRKSTITIQGTFNFDGFNASNLLTLQSSSVGTRFNIDVQNYVEEVNYVDVRDSEALSNDIIARASLDTTNTDSNEGTPQWDFRGYTNITATANLGGTPGDGGTIVILDCNNDGYLDVYMNDDTNGVTTDRLRQNDQDNTFTDRDTQTTGDGRGAGAGDFDNDGDIDLIVGFAQNLYENSNMANCTFAAPVTQTSNNMEAIMFADIDGDGDLDIWNPGEDYLWHRNDGTTSFSAQATMPGGAGTTPNGEGATAADFTNDGWIDYLWADAATTSEAFENDGDDTYTLHTDVATDFGLPANVGPHENMEWAWGDCNNDGDLDLYVSGVDNEGLYTNDGSGNFTSQGAIISFSDPDGADWGDFDNDGDLDLLVVNAGGVSELFENNGLCSFTEVAALWNVSASNDIGKTAGFFDVDNDGDLDIISNNPLNLWRNDIDDGAYLVVIATGTGLTKGSPVTPIGAQITIFQAGTMNIVGYQEIVPSFNQFAPPFRKHFGLDPTASYDVRVRFPSGIEITRNNVVPNTETHMIGATTLNNTIEILEARPIKGAIIIVD